LFSSQAYSQDDDDEEISLTTYYPAPYGSYSNIRLAPSPEPANPQKGLMYYDDGNSSRAEGLYWYDGASWRPMAQGGLEYIGGAMMEGPMDVFKNKLINYFSPPKVYHYKYNINNWVVDDGSHEDFKRHPSDSRRLWFITRGDLSAGVYKIRYGGGSFKFLTGKTMLVQLYIHHSGLDWHIMDDYMLTNPAAIDGVPCNFANAPAVKIPFRETSFHLYNNYDCLIMLRFNPMSEELDWDSEIGPYYKSAEWSSPPVGDPDFDESSYVCNPDMRNDLCGINPSGGTPREYNDFKRSYKYMKKLNKRGGGILDGVTLEVYKES
jgi:hypothetical protein